MNNFFKTLLTWNWANIGKAVVGGATGLLTYPAVIATVPIIPVPMAIIIAVVIGAGSALGMHVAHTAEPPIVPVGERK